MCKLFPSGTRCKGSLTVILSGPRQVQHKSRITVHVLFGGDRARMALLTKVRVGTIHVRGCEKLIAELFPVKLSTSSVLFERVAATVLVGIAIWGLAPLLMLLVNLIRNFLDEAHSLDVMRKDVAHKIS